MVGYEVHTTQNGHHVEDICDQLAGKYPKDFEFKGWHPNCMCYAVPILKTEEEIWADDSENSTESVNEITDVPEGFKEWIKDNEERIERADERGALPYFIKDNRGEVEKILRDEEEPKKTALEIAEKRHAARTSEDVERIQKEWKNHQERIARIKTNSVKYEEYGDKGWDKLYFDSYSGGFNVAHKLHQFSNSKPKGAPKSGGEAEKWLGVQLAKQGKEVEFLPESGVNGESGDMRFDGKEWDCKYIPLANEKTIRAYFKDARKADCVIFTFEEENRYDDIMKAVNREIGRYKSEGKDITELPDVYMMDNSRHLRLIKKIKGT